MRKIVSELRSTLLRAAITGFAMSCGIAVADAVPNANLDQQSQNTLVGWTYADNNAQRPIAVDQPTVNSKRVTISREEEPSGSGRYFLRADGGPDSSLTLSSGRFKVQPGLLHELRYEYRAEGQVAPACTVCVIAFVDGKEIQIGELRTFANSADWTLIGDGISVPRGTEFIQIRPSVINKIPDSTVRVDFRGFAFLPENVADSEPAGTGGAGKRLRRDARPTEGVVYARNLLKNGDVESGQNGQPEAWTYVGKSEPDWTEEQISLFHGNGRPTFDIGRGKGEWTHARTYQGKGALLNQSIDPPLSKRLQWYGRNAVDGYWLSDPMPCAPGQTYMAGAWIRPGATIFHCWYGPLDLQFFDKNGKRVPLAKDVRAAVDAYPPNTWNYWFTRPHIAPANAVTMRLRFGQELSADRGGWGKTRADNLAVWEVPPEGALEKAQYILADNHAARNWFRETHVKTKPPYLPSPTAAAEYQSAWGTIQNTAPGNIFNDPQADVKLRFMLFNALGEDRTLSIKGVRTDWKGNASEPFVTPNVTVPAYSQAPVEISLPAMSGYGAFHLECAIMENDATVGKCIGRYAVIPLLERQRTQENIWAVTLLRWNTSPYEPELGRVLQIGGFGTAWVRDYSADDPNNNPMHDIQFYRSAGLKVVLQLNPRLADWKPSTTDSFDPAPYFEYGRSRASKYKGLVAAYGEWGIEQSNCRTAEHSVYRPVKNGQFLNDREYDLIYCAIHDGIRSVDQQTPILIGNIATDPNADAIRRMYGQPVNGRFDGAIINAYTGLIDVALSALAEFDKHGDTTRTIWQEESAFQRSPILGSSRRYHEIDGAANLVRTWIALACKAHPRIRTITQWGFSARNREDEMADATMMDVGYQPRPHYVVHAVMADALADAEYKADRSTSAMSLFEFMRSDGPLLVAWSVAGRGELVLDTGGRDLTVMDIMGNRTLLKARGPLVTVELGVSPVYAFGPTTLTISQ